MIIIQKVDLHTPKLDKLNEAINAGYKPVAWVPYNNRVIVFLEGKETATITEKDGVRTYEPLVDPLAASVAEAFDALPDANDAICIGTTVAGNLCKGARFDGTEYCVAHQDQG